MAQTKLEHLDDNINGIKNLIEDRNKLLGFWFKEDQYDDFLLAEKLQSMQDTAGLNVQPVKAGSLDLSPINNLLPNEIRHNVAGRIDPQIVNLPTPAQVASAPTAKRNPKNPTNNNQGNKKKNNQGNNKNKKTSKLASGGITTSFSSPSVKSLAETGFDDTFYKNISSSIEDDFRISDVLKKAFGDAMALPVRAAAAALSDLISKIPIQSETQKNVLNENISSVSSAFHLQRNASIQEIINRQKTNVEGSETVNKWAESILNTTNNTQIAQGRSNERLNLLNPFDWPKMLDEAEKARKGERPNAGDHELSAPGNILKWHQRNAEYMKMLSFNSITGGNISQVMNNITTGTGDSNNIINSISNVSNVSETLIPKTDTVTNNLTTLTDKVLTENRVNFDEKTLIEKAVAQIPQEPTKNEPGPENMGSDNAMSKVVHSPFFEEYSKMTQFDYVS